MTTTHANLSPSKRHRWAACPASIREEAKYPEERSGAAAVDGTHTHTLLDKCISTGMMPASMMVGMTLKDHDGEFVVDLERAARVQVALDYINDRQKELGMSAVRAEGKVNPVSLTGRNDLGGTVDISIMNDDCVEIADYKDGMSLVEPDALQMRQYFIGLVSPYIKNGVIPFKKARLTVIQPKLAAKGIPPVRSKDFDAQELFDSELPKLLAEARATDDPNAPFVPGDEQCKYCRHKGACSALTNQAMTAAGISFANLDVAKQAADKEPTTMSPEQIREIMEAAPLIRQLLDGVEAEALRRFKAGQVVAGLKMVRGKGSRAWAYPEAEMVEKLKKFGLPKDILWKTSLITPAQTEKVMWQKKDGTVKQLSERQLKILHEEYITKKDGNLCVVSASDSRDAVSLSVDGMFAPSEPDKSVAPALPSFLQIPDFLK